MYYVQICTDLYYNSFFNDFLLAFAFKFPGRDASVLISVSVNSITATEPELRQTAKMLGKPGFHKRFPTLTPAETIKHNLVEEIERKWIINYYYQNQMHEVLFSGCYIV